MTQWYNATEAKRCSRCDTWKTLDAFYRDRSQTDGRYRQCRACAAETKKLSNRRVREQDPDNWNTRRRAAVARYRERHPHRVKATDKAQNLRKFGLTPAGFAALKQEQGGQCAICRAEPAPTRDLAVDHDHATGKVRGLLCSNCNTALGLFGDNPERLDAAREYLTKGRLWHCLAG